MIIYDINKMQSCLPICPHLDASAYKQTHTPGTHWKTAGTGTECGCLRLRLQKQGRVAHRSKAHKSGLVTGHTQRSQSSCHKAPPEAQWT
jgi:hypothetical protein